MLARRGLALPFPDMTSERVDRFLRARQPEGNLLTESFAASLPPEYDGLITKGLLLEGLFESFSRSDIGTSKIQNGKHFLTFLYEWRKQEIKRVAKNNNTSSQNTISLLLDVNPETAYIYAAKRCDALSSALEGMSPHNLLHPEVEETHNRWKIFEEAALTASVIRKGYKEGKKESVKT